MDEKKKVTINPIITEVKESLGRDYHRVLTWYHIMHPSVKKMKEEHYKEMEREWKICKAVENMIEIDNDSSISTCTVEEQYLERTYRFFSTLFNGDKSANDDSEKRNYIAECINQFKRETSTETLHKSSITLLKMSLEDISFDVSGNAMFDSRNASTYIGANINRQNNGSCMRWVASSEDGISRLLEKYGLSQVIVFMGEQGKTPEDNEKLLATKENIFLRGITDVSNGKHYMCSAPSASSTRHADFPFIEAESPVDVFKIWCEITGFKTIEDLIKGIGSFKDGRYIVNLAKLKARIAMRGSNSFDTYQTVQNPTVLFRLKHPNVDYVRDASGTTNVPYKGITSPGVLEMKNSDGTVTTERV